MFQGSMRSLTVFYKGSKRPPLGLYNGYIQVCKRLQVLVSMATDTLVKPSLSLSVYTWTHVISIYIYVLFIY